MQFKQKGVIKMNFCNIVEFKNRFRFVSPSCATPSFPPAIRVVSVSAFPFSSCVYCLLDDLKKNNWSKIDSVKITNKNLFYKAIEICQQKLCCIFRIC